MYTTATSESNGTSASNLANRIMQTRGYCIPLPDYNSNTNSLKDRIREQLRTMKSEHSVFSIALFLLYYFSITLADEMEDENSNEGGGFLKVFKLNHGYKLELFEDLFIRPNELQVALLLEPSKRLVQDVEVIATTLRLFPFLRGLSDSGISDLATAVEYRALTSQDEIFSQNMPASAMCLLLKGAVQVKMQNDTGGALIEDIMLGELPQYSTFGHIDFLFRHKNAFIVKELEEILYPKPHSRQQQGGGSGAMNESFMSSTSNLKNDAGGGTGTCNLTHWKVKS